MKKYIKEIYNWGSVFDKPQDVIKHVYRYEPRCYCDYDLNVKVKKNIAIPIHENMWYNFIHNLSYKRFCGTTKKYISVRLNYILEDLLRLTEYTNPKKVARLKKRAKEYKLKNKYFCSDKQLVQIHFYNAGKHGFGADHDPENDCHCRARSVWSGVKKTIHQKLEEKIAEVETWY